MHPLSYVREQRSWTQQDLVNVIARRLNTAARREKAWRWERWGVVPDEDTQLALADELGVDRQTVKALGWPHWLPTGPTISTATPWTFDGAVALLDDTAGPAVLDRRGFLIMHAGLAVAIAERWLAAEPPRINAALQGGRVDADLLDCFEQRLPALRRMDASLGGGSVRSLVDAELRLVTDLLRHSSYSEASANRLLTVAAELGRIAGWASFDAGFHAAAERYWLAALHAAHSASDRAAGANILKCMSLQRVDTERPTEALRLAEAAWAGAKNAPARVRAMLTTRLARAHAVLGESVACERRLAEADTEMSRADDETNPAWASYFDHAEYSAQVAACYLLLQRHQASDQWLQQTLALQPAERSRDRATYLIWRADSVFNLGDIDHACALVAEAAPDVAASRSVRNHRRLLDIHGRLTVHRHPAVTALDERVRTLLA
ncbi:transcriptional regulator [Micromonospora sp. HM134]|uniref:transcriptional regulator n=1 Tax=Micromonospora sp. HM134 TaxID=2583243 RepID=UPI001F0DC9C1|nr:transcriptional regulator [Micromonospora sp. HM134]